MNLLNNLRENSFNFSFDSSLLLLYNEYAAPAKPAANNSFPTITFTDWFHWYNPNYVQTGVQTGINLVHPENMLKELYTIGHSVMGLEDFISLLKTYEIRVLADVRAFPFSRRMTHFNQDVLDKELTKNGISYLHMKELGGRRKFDPDKPDYGWTHRSFAAYAQYLQTEQFAEEAEKLAHAAEKEKTAIMCAEKLWWKCHRRMISDYFLSRGWDVKHILTDSKLEPHILSPQFRSYQPSLF